MYAEKILEVKFLPRRGVYMLKPVMKTFDAELYLTFGEKLTVRSVPRGKEDYILLDYYSVVDSVYDSARVMKSIKYNDVGVEGRYYAHDEFVGKYENIVVDVDFARRLRKLDWAFEEFFESYLLGVEEAKKYVDDELWKYANAYLISVKTEEHVPDGIIVSIPSPFDVFSKLDVTVYDGKARARVVGKPVNSICFLAALRKYDVGTLFDVYYKRPERVWVHRLYRKYMWRVLDAFMEYLDRLNPKCDVGLFSRRRITKIVVYPFDPLYDERKYFEEIMKRKKELYLGR